MVVSSRIKRLNTTLNSTRSKCSINYYYYYFKFMPLNLTGTIRYIHTHIHTWHYMISCINQVSSREAEPKIYIKRLIIILKFINTNLLILFINNMCGPWGHYARWYKSAIERQIPHDLIYMWNLKHNSNNKSSSQIQRTYRGCQRRGCRVGKMGEGGQKDQTSSYKTNKSWGHNVQDGDHSSYYCIVYLKVAKRVDLKCSLKKKIL